MSKEVIIIQKNIVVKDDSSYDFFKSIRRYIREINAMSNDVELVLIPFDATILRAKELSKLDTKKMIKCVDDIKNILEEKVKEDD